jgi:hypothetical protein
MLQTRCTAANAATSVFLLKISMTRGEEIHVVSNSNESAEKKGFIHGGSSSLPHRCVGLRCPEHSNEKKTTKAVPNPAPWI